MARSRSLISACMSIWAASFSKLAVDQLHSHVPGSATSCAVDKHSHPKPLQDWSEL